MKFAICSGLKVLYDLIYHPALDSPIRKILTARNSTIGLVFPGLPATPAMAFTFAGINYHI